MKQKYSTGNRIRTARALGGVFFLGGAVLVVVAFILAKGTMPDWLGRSATGPMFILMGAVNLIVARRLSKVSEKGSGSAATSKEDNCERT